MWAGWSKEKQAWHDTMSGTRYVEEKQYSGGWTWLANALPIILMVGILATIGVAQFQSYFEAAEQARLQQEQGEFQNLYDPEYELGEEQSELNLTPEQIEEIKKAFEVQIEEVKADGEIEVKADGEIEVEATTE